MQQSLKGKKILVVDDHPFFRITIRKTLEALGCEMYEATDGYTAIDVAQAIEPDLVIVDYIMPGKDGIQTCKDLKAVGSLKQTHLVMFTDQSMKQVVIDAIKAGVKDFITKTAGMDVIVKKIEDILLK